MCYLRWLGITVSLLMVAALSGFISMRYAIRGTTVLMPDLVGQMATDASATLTAKSLGMRIVGRKPQPGVVPGVVLSQDPMSGTPVKPNQMVRVVISSGEKKDVVPRVIGSSIRVAQLTLLRAGKNIGDVSRIHLGPEGVSEVQCQTPLPEETAGPGSAVHLLVNAGDREPGFVMPDLVGRDVNEVIRLFESSAIRIESVSYRSETGATIGQVLAQQPDRGYRVTRDMPVRIVVSR